MFLCFCEGKLPPWAPNPTPTNHFGTHTHHSGLALLIHYYTFQLRHSSSLISAALPLHSGWDPLQSLKIFRKTLILFHWIYKQAPTELLHLNIKWNKCCYGCCGCNIWLFGAACCYMSWPWHSPVNESLLQLQLQASSPTQLDEDLQLRATAGETWTIPRRCLTPGYDPLQTPPNKPKDKCTWFHDENEKQQL